MNTENFKPYQSFSQEVKRRLAQNDGKQYGVELPVDRDSEHHQQNSDKHFQKWSFKHSLINKLQWVADKIIYAIAYLKGEIITVEDDSAVFYSFSRIDRRNLLRKGGAYKTEGGAIILMSNLVVMKKLIAVMNLKGSKADKAQQCVKIINTAKTSTYCSIPLATINILLGLAEAYSNSKPGNKESTWTNLNNAMQAMMYIFQKYANENPQTAHSAILSGGFSVKKITPRKAQKWSVKNNPIQGVLDLHAGGSGSYTCHTWWISFDGKTFEQFATTMDANAQLSGLASGMKVWFMHEVIGKDGPQGFDLVAYIRVD
jgi:hypothetical protein